MSASKPLGFQRFALSKLYQPPPLAGVWFLNYLTANLIISMAKFLEASGLENTKADLLIFS